MESNDLLTNLITLNLNGVSISAQIDEHGNFYPVKESFQKLLAASQARSLPRIHTVLVHPDSVKSIQLETQDEYLHVLTATDIDQAVEKLKVDQETRWGEISDYSDVFYRHNNLVGRHWLREKVNTAINNALAHSEFPPYILITGKPGTGKSAFIANLVKNDNQAAYHFIRRVGEQDNPDTLLRSLTAQLRKIHALTIQNQDSLNTPAEIFAQTLNRVSQRLESGESQVIWIDGLDEAYGPTGRFSNQRLDKVLPLSGLPRGIIFVLTSRYEGPLEWFNDDLLFHRIDLDEQYLYNLADITDYLSQQNQSLGLNLNTDFLRTMAEASEGCFVAAKRYLYPGAHLSKTLPEWSAHPDLIPTGLDGWLSNQWQILLTAAQEQSIPKEAVYGVLGYIAAQEGMITKTLKDDNYRISAKILTHFVDEQKLDQYFEIVVALSQEFFETTIPGLPRESRIRFFHSRFAEFILTKVQKKINEPDNLLRLPHPPSSWIPITIGSLLLIIIIAFVIPIWPRPPVELTITATASVTLHPTLQATILTNPSSTPTQAVWLVMLKTPIGMERHAKVNVGMCTLYRAPAGDAVVITNLQRNTVVRVFGREQSEDWLMVITAADEVGWVRSTDLKLDTSIQSLLEVLPLSTLAPTDNMAYSPTATNTPTSRPKKISSPSSTPYP